MFELLAKLNINFSTKDQVLELMDKCNTLLVGGKASFYIWHFMVLYSGNFLRPTCPPKKYPLPSPGKGPTI